MQSGLPTFARKLLELKNQNKRLQFGCDPRDGAISVNVEVFVPDTPWTVSQVQWRRSSRFQNVVQKRIDSREDAGLLEGQ
ncbi:MAG: hypothetical protein NZ557_15385 [Chthonomonadaceae bacterium]|nr:hypothetical protein [Chthonomonadaceae bacterium]